MSDALSFQVNPEQLIRANRIVPNLSDNDSSKAPNFLLRDDSDSISSGSSQHLTLPVACLACRSRHLKCDGGVRCSRCKADGVECSYVKSRRGWTGRRVRFTSEATEIDYPKLLDSETSMAVDSATQDLPCDTLCVSNLPIDTSEDELKDIFSKQQGYKRMCFRVRQNGSICFVEFENIACAVVAMQDLDGYRLRNSSNGRIHLSFSKQPLGARSPNKFASASQSTIKPQLFPFENPGSHSKDCKAQPN